MLGIDTIEMDSDSFVQIKIEDLQITNTQRRLIIQRERFGVHSDRVFMQQNGIMIVIISIEKQRNERFSEQPQKEEAHSTEISLRALNEENDRSIFV
jgi:hypothetical protein